ncbi:MAG: hypothetical protein WDN69_16685 [Aliidongia sp.]
MFPYTVDAGHFQYETDAPLYTYSKQGSVSTRQWTIADPTLKLGMTQLDGRGIGGDALHPAARHEQRDAHHAIRFRLRRYGRPPQDECVRQ